MTFDVPFIVQGRAHLLELFEPAALRKEASDEVLECVRVFEVRLARSQKRDWTGAIAFFAKSARLEPHQPGSLPEIEVNPIAIFLSMTQSFRDNSGSGPIVV